MTAPLSLACSSSSSDYNQFLLLPFVFVQVDLKSNEERTHELLADLLSFKYIPNDLLDQYLKNLILSFDLDS